MAVDGHCLDQRIHCLVCEAENVLFIFPFLKGGQSLLILSQSTRATVLIMLRIERGNYLEPCEERHSLPEIGQGFPHPLDAHHEVALLPFLGIIDIGKIEHNRSPHYRGDITNAEGE